MKTFLISDLHCNYKNLRNISKIINSNSKYEAIIFAGDVLNMGETIGYCNKFLEVIDKSQKPFFWVPGNNDFGRGYYKIKAKYPSLEGRVLEHGGIKVTGVGGSPASWSGQYAGEKMIDKKSIAGSIFVSHFPPPVILNWSKEDYTLSPVSLENHKSKELKPNLGSSYQKNQSGNSLNLDIRALDLSASKRLVDSPLIHICGHIHHQWGVSYLGQTKVVKLAAAELGNYAILDTNDLSVTFSKF